MPTPLKSQTAGFSPRVAGEDLTQETVRMDVAIAIEIGCERRRASPLFRLEELAQFGGVALIRQRRAPDMDLAVLEARAFARIFVAISIWRIREFRCGFASDFTSLTLEGKFLLSLRKALRSKISSELLAEHDFNLAALHRA